MMMGQGSFFLRLKRIIPGIRWKSRRSSSGRTGDSGGGTSFDNFGAWDSTSDLPLQVEASIESGKPIPSVGIKNVGVSSVKGRRSYNEDQYGIEQLDYFSYGIGSNKPAKKLNTALYVAVFDGHGNDACAKFCANVFPKHVRNG
jgi:hypothetical protein